MDGHTILLIAVIGGILAIAFRVTYLMGYRDGSDDAANAILDKMEETFDLPKGERVERRGGRK
ncbi:putative membrane bound protein [Bacillus phage vB_BmeM-Goe8]|uniref:Putative membrane bound protein n=1 Tax=Bacillus phage vB_BmeM-Goe8 TaxID=2593638 RepID=A0A516KN23_9CAUD|nr:putative membrane bound protein [Bacillus phage vB_BmeM-Goe8]QDP42994.1 putative membrane bound protein [Bacillus phage vB_BmeM-Goe8]